MAVSLIVIMPVILIIIGSKDPIVKVNTEYMEIGGMYGLNIRFSEILKADTLSNLPGISRRTNGYEFGNTLKGNFALTDGKKAKLFIRNAIPPYIHLQTNNLNLYLNFKDPAKTMILFKMIGTYLK